MMSIGKLADLPLSEFTASAEINLLSCVYLIQPALPHLRRKGGEELGRIVFISSDASSTGVQAWGLYSMAKAGMNSICQTLAIEEKEAGIATWAVRPGMVDVSPCLVTLGLLVPELT
jgi:NAD(P)-dependent dehydrogenase (short-subunit alcohol dehydrogenase family)